MVPLQYQSNFWGTLDMALINCEINLILTWLANCIILANSIDNQVPTFEMTDTKTRVPAIATIKIRF